MLLLAIAQEKWQSLYVVICQVHQARHDEVVTQYFERVFNEFQGMQGREKIGSSLENHLLMMNQQH